MARARKRVSTPLVTLRPATPDDAARLLAWRNDVETRHQSRSSARVTSAAHAKWLSSTLSNSEIHLFIASDASGEDIGTGRIDYRGQSMAEINLTVAPGHRRRGFARAIIEALGAEASRLGWPHLLARVKSGNAPSLRAFNGAGFTRDGCIHFEREL